MYVEVIECENIFTTQLAPKLLDNNLQMVKSQENLMLLNPDSETNSQLNFNLHDSQSQPQLAQQQSIQTQSDSSPKSENSMNIAEQIQSAISKIEIPKI